VLAPQAPAHTLAGEAFCDGCMTPTPTAAAVAGAGVGRPLVGGVLERGGSNARAVLTGRRCRDRDTAP
jgi:hypothetical protein